MKGWRFIAGALVVLVVGALLPRLVTNAYVFYAGFIALQYVVIATAWNILGGYAGYVNFGSGAFVGLGVYAAVFLFNAIARAALGRRFSARRFVGGLLGLGMGYLTLRIQGVYFSIATLALTIVSQHGHRQLELSSAARAGRRCWRPSRPAGFPARRQLCLLRHAGAGGGQRGGRALDRAIVDRPRPGRASRR